VIAVNQQIASLHEDLKRQVENAYRVEKVSLEEMEARRAKIVEELAEARTELDAVPDKERQVAEMEAMIKKLEERHSLLLQRQSETEIARAGQSDWDVVILTHAGPPYSKKTRDYVRLALGPLLSLIVGLGLAFFLESVDHSVKNQAEAEEYLDVPVLATISDFEAKRSKVVGRDA